MNHALKIGLLIMIGLGLSNCKILINGEELEFKKIDIDVEPIDPPLEVTSSLSYYDGPVLYTHTTETTFESLPAPIAVDGNARTEFHLKHNDRGQLNAVFKSSRRPNSYSIEKCSFDGQIAGNALEELADMILNAEISDQHVYAANYRTTYFELTDDEDTDQFYLQSGIPLLAGESAVEIRAYTNELINYLKRIADCKVTSTDKDIIIVRAELNQKIGVAYSEDRQLTRSLDFSLREGKMLLSGFEVSKVLSQSSTCKRYFNQVVLPDTMVLALNKIRVLVPIHRCDAQRPESYLGIELDYSDNTSKFGEVGCWNVSQLFDHEEFIKQLNEFISHTVQVCENL